MTYCPWCGEPLTGTPYCGSCGAPTEGSAETRGDDHGERRGKGLLIATLAAVGVIGLSVTAWWFLVRPDATPVAVETLGAASPSPGIAEVNDTASPTPSPSPSPSPTPSPPPPTWVETFSGVRSGVVRIEVDTCDGQTGSGSGFLVAEDQVVTAAHVVSNAADFRVQSEGRDLSGQVIGFDQGRDLALVQLDGQADGHVFDLTVRPLDIAEEVAAAGYPISGELSLTRGSVSGVDLALTGNFGEIAGVVRTDAAVNPGNSGGPLLLADGTVAGVVLAKYVATEVEGVGYALTAEVAAPLVRAWEQASQPVDMSCPAPADLPPDDPPPAVADDPPPNGSFGFAEVPSWIAIVESLEVGDYSYDEAFNRSLAYDQRLGVVTQVLLSTDYSSLNAGYWVIYVGSWDDEDDAAAFCRANRDVTEVCYQRFLDY